MYKDDLLKNLERELVLLKRLTPFITEQDLDFRPYEGARSNYELMQYLSGLGAVMLRWLIKNDITPEVWEKDKAYRKTLTIQNFQERLDEQWKNVLHYMESITEDDLLNMEVQLPSKEKMMLGAAIMNAPIKWLASYRLQLFVNLKMNGHKELGTKEAWTLIDYQVTA